MLDGAVVVALALARPGDRRVRGTLVSMSSQSDAILRKALDLSEPERAEVAAELLASLDEPTDDDPDVVRSAWAEELEVRSARARSGADPGEPWLAVRDRLRAKFTG